MSLLRIISADDVRRALPMGKAIEAMKSAFAQLSAGQAIMPQRSRIDVPGGEGLTLFMPGFLRNEGDAAEGGPGSMAVKVVSVFPGNAARGLPTILGVVLLIDASTGQAQALLDGAALTAIRTGAASGLATDVLARPDARTVAIFGSGVQARTQLEAVCTVRRIESACVYSPNRDHAAAFAAEAAGKNSVPPVIRVATSPEQALADADIVCTATTSPTPVFEGRLLRDGTHVNAIGSFQPHVQEVDAETIRRALVVVDSFAAALEEAGDLLVPIAQGLFRADQIHAELGEIILGHRPARTSHDQITFFKSCGLAVQDAAAARACYDAALASESIE
jgi:ornithine cyclodeaminase/alanine dehydrogenase-like protein (mu-crystallin family)